MRLHLLIAAACVLGLSTWAQAAYVMSVESGGGGSLSVNPGDSLSLDVVMTRDAADTLASALFTVEFDTAGLEYDSYLWGAPFATNDSFLDVSDPQIAALTTTLATGTYVAGVGDPGTVDVLFDNALLSGSFPDGTLLSLDLTVPLTFAPGLVNINVVPDFITLNGIDAIATTAGADFVLTILPEPSTMTILALALVALVRPRRHAAG